MAFKEFLFAHFPHRWLNIKKTGTNKLFSGLGNIFDRLEIYTEIPVRNNSTRTAIEALAELENEYGITINPSLSIELRRAKIIAKKRMSDGPITKPQLISIFGALGVEIGIVNYFNESIMVVTINLNEYSIPYKELLSVLYENIRAHVGLAVEIPDSFFIEIYSGIYVEVQNHYYIEFTSYDPLIEIQSNIYTSNMAVLENRYNIEFSTYDPSIEIQSNVSTANLIIVENKYIIN